MILELMVLFALLSFGASFVNGALGYGYSSISTPLALLVLVNRIVNPAYVLLEAIANTIMIGLSGKKNIKATFRRTLPIMLGVAPAAVIGSLVLATLTTSAPNWAKLIVYASILPLILLQSAGIRRAIKREAAAGVPLGVGIGLLYSITTISGPPIALFWNNQGMKKEEFKAAIAQVRITESYITCISYYFLGLFGATVAGTSAMQLFFVIAPPVAIGLPLGYFAIRRLNIETFRRVAMSFDAWIVSYGLTRVLNNPFNLNINIANALFVLFAAISAILLYRYFKKKAAQPIAEKAEPVPLQPLLSGMDSASSEPSTSAPTQEFGRDPSKT
jgi:uncharacterized protein